MKHISLAAMWIASAAAIAFAISVTGNELCLFALIIPAITHEGAVKRN